MLSNRMVEAAHLLRRTGFGPTLEEIRQYSRMSHAEAVARLLTIEPQKTDLKLDLVKQLQASNIKEAEWGQSELQQVWLDTMLKTPTPLAEKLALFWHNHFTSSIYKVEDSHLMLAQNRYFRFNSLGNFGEMVRYIARDPAMLIYLDGVDNSKDNPNENFARELMELFTLGIGNYGEQDVREAARAFTGWQIDEEKSTDNNRVVVYSAENHDDDPKTFMGQRGNFDGEAIIKLILQQPQTAFFVANKLWKFLISPNPTPAQVQPLADLFFKSGYNIQKLVEAILLSPDFLSPAAYRSLVKSPVELVVGTVRSMGSQAVEGDTVGRLGQSLFAPPNVRGWLGDRHWINSATLLGRINYATDLTSTDVSDDFHLDALLKLLKEATPGDPTAFQDLAQLLVDNQASGLDEIKAFMAAPWQSLPDDQAERRQEFAARLRGAAHLLVSCPEYQLN